MTSIDYYGRAATIRRADSGVAGSESSATLRLYLGANLAGMDSPRERSASRLASGNQDSSSPERIRWLAGSTSSETDGERERGGDRGRDGARNRGGELMGRETKNIKGQRFSRLVVIGLARESRHGHTQWFARCDCGATRVIDGSDLRRGQTKSCGCLNRERHTRHGMSRTSEYSAYRAAKRRCTNPRTSDYERYGGRGVQFRFESFEQFFSALGPKPTRCHSIDRFPDPNGHYEPGNVRWATAKQQANNRRPRRKRGN